MGKVLVTGCGGFIGSSLCYALLQDGYYVTGIDIFTSNYERWIKERNLESLKQFSRFRFMEVDLAAFPLASLLDKVDYVFHLAAIPGVRTSWGEHFAKYAKNNVLATQLLLEAVKHSSIKKMIYASSSSVYGGMMGSTDEQRTPHPISPYGVTKLAAEHLCQLYARNFHVPVISLRYFTVFGPRQRPDMAFHKMIYSILQDAPVTIFGDGEQSRDFTFIKDAVTANILAMQSPYIGEVFNVGGISRLRINEIIDIIEKQTGQKAKRQYLPEQPGDPKHTWADITKAKNMLQYDPQFDVEKGMYLQIQDVKTLYNL
ncbi:MULTISPECIES: NAD-dependent epimerase/dehydratase family protein [Aneurinibacillus]|uniref:NAD-dependent epimerase/dehydratase family protein n=1 Tax=Aneurinibacillus thermoaerophilus TaxID=143495 RepID=A0A1G7Y2A6_ANETH|nr:MULTISPECIES: NAD-dependent epimerase/dehydratase family protein [Aneurinibacillus]AMA72958.1 UDP-glucose 4-epimerase [Aneurinibacillus sp. XH2]MED0675899.1 NAD-dependent epimerase/dehydratase family protein [Aneurinibacillus thermoaerophilus]MED0677826.1 NAD-dependent epimerase/dehydratase family protein [Aneurinibacillus thermoaerophilus]MED0737575.1 NAD-dependent epimerase/dehydratase family protein [Aneurinibacillus thermoaerophilus]MED0758146.1 NAD-dependent epimerase/dehydratase famil